MKKRDQSLPAAVKHIRYSTDEQENSLLMQDHGLTAFAAGRYRIPKKLPGFTLQHFRDGAFVDEAIGGASSAGKRKGFQEMVNVARSGNCPFRYVLVYDLSRFGRGDRDEMGHYRYLLRRAGVGVNKQRAAALAEMK